MSKDTKIISDLRSFFAKNDDNRAIKCIMGVMEHINIRSSQIGVEKKENCKFTTLQVLNLLMLFPFFIVKNASRYSNSYCPFSRLPLASYEDRAAFKIFVLDVGLLGAMSNLKAKSLRQFVADNQSKKAYRISMNDYQQGDWVTNVPLYAVNGLKF